MKARQFFKKRRRFVAAGLAVLQLASIGAVSVSAAETLSLPKDEVVAGISSEDPGFDYGTYGQDYVTGQEYYYLENSFVKTLIGPKKGANNAAGPFSNGAIMDAVAKSSNRENLDWTQFLFDSKMGAWNYNAPSLSLDTLEVQGNTIVGKGASTANANIQGEVTYSIVKNTPLIKIQVDVSNTGSEDYQGYFNYMIDPDESREQESYVPGVGWVSKTSTKILTNHEWTDTYIFEGSSTAYSGKTAHAILWDEKDGVPSGLANCSNTFGIWYDASMKAGESKTLTFYHLAHQPGAVEAPYSEAEFWAKVVRGEIKAEDYDVVTGTVTDENGLPISGADIACQYAVGEHIGENAANAVTNESGEYSMRLKRDVYTMTASVPGYEERSQSVDLTQQVSPKADIVLPPLNGARILESTSLKKFGGLVEGKIGDYTMENGALNLSLAKGTSDQQLKNSSAGRILDIEVNGKADAMDWIFTSWISDVKPENDANAGSSFNQLDTQFDKFEVVSQSKEKIVLKATGIYHHDLEKSPDAKAEGEIEQIITMEKGNPYIEIETSIRNVSGDTLQLYVGDAMDTDVNPQQTYAPGIGEIENAPYIDEKPDQPWMAQCDDSGLQLYSFLYEDSFDVNVFGSNAWIMGYAPVTLESEDTFTYNRQIVVLDTEGYEKPYQAMDAYYNAYKNGLKADIEVYEGDVQKGDIFPVKITVNNSAETPVKDLKVSLDLPYQMMHMGESTITIPEIPANSSKTVEFSVLALEGGRGMMKADVSRGTDVSIKFSQALSISGEGHYAGDDHTHSTNSDGKGTIRQNVDSAYEDKMLSWLYSTDHNAVTQKAETEAETKRHNGKFISITGTEISSPGKGHALAYGVGDAVPEYRVGKEVNGKVLTWQDIVDSVNEDGGLFYVAHPNYPGIVFSDPYGIREYTGIEVWNGFYHAMDADKNVNTFAFDYWDDVNRRGDKKYFGIANSDGHSYGKMGDPYIKTEMNSLTYENIQEILGNGSYYGSNGPELRYDIEGVGMGETLNIKQNGKVDFNITAFDPNYDLVNVKLIKNTITGDTDGKSEVIFNEDLKDQGLKEFKTTLSLDVKPNEFYRIEVVSEKGTTGDGGKGMGQGQGFAYSNPIWIGSSEKSNATDIKKITYEGGEVIETTGGNKVIDVNGTFSIDKLKVEVSDGATVSTEMVKETKGSLDTATAVNIIVTAEDGTKDVETVFLMQEDEETVPEITALETVEVETQKGSVPQLPQTVKATFNDGTTKDVAVVWDEITQDMVAQPGEVTIEGTVTGTAIKAKAIVTVVETDNHSKTEIKNAKEATCTEEGYTGDKVCVICGKVVEKGQIIEKKAHDYQEGKCTVCGAIDPNYVPVDPTDPTDPTNPDNGDTDSPQTGDSSNMAAWIALLFASGVGVLGTVYSKKKKSE